MNVQEKVGSRCDCFKHYIGSAFLEMMIDRELMNVQRDGGESNRRSKNS